MIQEEGKCALTGGREMQSHRRQQGERIEERKGKEAGKG